MDIYHGPHRGLMTADIEFDSIRESRSFQAPDWFGRARLRATDNMRMSSSPAAAVCLATGYGVKSWPFVSKRKELVAKAIRRPGRERIEDGPECLKERGRAEAIHCARNDIKKVRAVVRLARAEIQKKHRRRITGLLREAAKHLAAPRDAYVKARTLKNLARHFKDNLHQEHCATSGRNSLSPPIRK
jgi:hypothetical protein